MKTFEDRAPVVELLGGIDVVIEARDTAIKNQSREVITVEGTLCGGQF